MATATDILTLTQWLSPAFPVGGFQFSHGLAQAIDSGAVRDAESLRDWCRDVLTLGAGQADAILMAAAYQADDPAPVDALARALAASAERLTETCQMGAAFARATGALIGADLPPLTYPVALGHAAARQGLPQELTAAMMLHGFVTNLSTIGQRLIPLGQTPGQALIQELAPLCAQIAADTAHGDTERIATCAFASDIAAMRHETQYARICLT